MNLTNVDTIQKLMRDSSTLRTALTKYKEATAPSHIDKHAFVFKEGSSDRFRCFQLSAYLEGYTGAYGSSSCYTFLSLDSGKVNEVFAEYLEDNKEAILQELSTRLKVKAQRLVANAEKEIADLQSSLLKVKEEKE